MVGVKMMVFTRLINRKIKDLIMNEKFAEITETINQSDSLDGNVFNAVFNKNNATITVTNTDMPDAVVIVSATENQILTQTPLFSEQEIKEDERAELNRKFLNIGLVMPLSGIGINNGLYVIFGSMATTTSIENIVHEIQAQVNNYTDVLLASEEHLA